MINDFLKQLKKILFFVENFDKAWKSRDLKMIFPPNTKNKIEHLKKELLKLSKYQEIINTFSDWESIGVWNSSDMITFLLTSRMSIYLADSIERDDVEGARQSIQYLLNFINYLLLTNIHPPSKGHKDFQPFYPAGKPFPRTYSDAQDRMRTSLAEYFAQKIYVNNAYKQEFEEILGITISSPSDLSRHLKNDFFPRITPPFLLKNVGLAKELYIFYKFISENIGFIIPTLLYQRIFKGLSSFTSDQRERFILVKTPDFIVVRGGRVIGIELGRERPFFRTQKAVSIVSFSGACGIPTTQINVSMGNPIIDKWYDFGIKCNRCYRSFTLCDAFIKGESGVSSSFYKLPKNSLKCRSICGTERAKKCMDAAALTGITNYRTGRKNKKLVHLKCLFDDEISEELEPIPLYPDVEGLDVVKEGLS